MNLLGIYFMTGKSSFFAALLSLGKYCSVMFLVTILISFPSKVKGLHSASKKNSCISNVLSLRFNLYLPCICSLSMCFAKTRFDFPLLLSYHPVLRFRNICLVIPKSFSIAFSSSVCLLILMHHSQRKYQILFNREKIDFRPMQAIFLMQVSALQFCRKHIRNGCNISRFFRLHFRIHCRF